MFAAEHGERTPEARTPVDAVSSTRSVGGRRQAGLTAWEVHVAAYRGELARDLVAERTDRV